MLDCGHDRVVAERALAAAARSVDTFGALVREPIDLPANVSSVIVTRPEDVSRYLPRRVLVQVTSVDEARAAVAAGASGVIAKGCEAGGRVGDETTFVLVQRLIAIFDAAPGGVGVWAQGGIGEHTAAACVAGGAAGVVLDSQLALLPESSLPESIRSAVRAMDGSETKIVDGHRVLDRPGSVESPATVPIGQDGAFAHRFARFGSVAAAVAQLHSAIAGHRLLAARHRPLAPDAPFAAAHGLRYPIAQGPMSRVSDRARFAQAVAMAGGLPFLALSLMDGAEVRALLTETTALLGDRPWGVGILGFVPPDVRDAQLAVITDFAPSVALIAGGLPAQTRPLEAHGIPAYLHAPSPGLLDMFLRDGARRFVFEGSECGGHVGPRTSFALWELQIERLLNHPRPDELSVLFAGGIHDARSAAMVAVLAAPLAARGVRVGVLLGTAYLFTTEAVAAGAIEPGFQEVALACDHTALLETSPGHATRCADTAYVRTFEQQAQRLAELEVAPKKAWAELEQLNLGRLRIAAKGLRRDGPAIVRVPPEVQRRDAMYMIGQVAALHEATCSIAELHDDVSVRGTALVRSDLDEEDRRTTNLDRPDDIAVVGVAAIYPGAADTETFWANIVAGTDAVREVPPERWSVETFYDPAATDGRKTPSKWGGFLDEVPFDPLEYGIPPRSLTAIEPVQLLALETARRALDDAGYGEREFDRSRTAVIFGAEAGTDLSSAYNFRAMFPHWVGRLSSELDDALPALSEDSFAGVLANVVAGRIANRLDLGGVSYTVDAACAASLAALDIAAKELATGSADMVLCGGADLHNSINDYLMFASVQALSPTGRCHTFDAKADGTVLGEGVGCVVLKRLADAERDGDRIYAVIKAIAGTSDGKGLGLTAPGKAGQMRALDRAYRQAGISPAAVGLVEAHGTGTVIGDRTELAALTEVYQQAGAASGGCVLGSVKSQIGHTKCAAGIAGLIKATLAIHHGVLPPTANLDQPIDEWQPGTSPFAFLDSARPWTAATRVAAVSAFGFGGANFHAVLRSYAPARTADRWPTELVLARGRDRATALARIEQLLADRPRLRDLARTAAADPGPVQLAVVAGSLDEVREAAAKPADAELGGAIAFLCPGQGSQRPGMLADLFLRFPLLHRWLEFGAAWLPKIYPPQAFTAETRAAQRAALTDTRVAQPALGVVDSAVAELLQLFGVRPDMVGGHSYGELAALGVAGVFTEADLVEVSAARGDCIAAAAEPGVMVAVKASATVTAPLLTGDVVVANHNSPSECVIAGTRAAIDASLAQIAAAGFATRRIDVGCAFHSPLVARAGAAFAERLASVPVHPPRIPVWSNVTAAPHRPDTIRDALAAQITQPVRFAEQIEAMYAAGARIFVETGPGRVLSRLTREILGDRPHLAVAVEDGLLPALARLAGAGVPVDPAPLFWDRDAVLLDTAHRSDARHGTARPTAWLVNGQRARPATAEPPKPVIPVAAAPTTADPAEVVVEYLRNMRSMIATQRDVLLAYLGSGAPHPAPEPTSDPLAPSPRAVEAGLPAPQPPVVTDPLQLVLSIVGERTGYPIETLGVDLDLEADLGIDSIKRIEIVGVLAQRLGSRIDNGGRDQEAVVDQDAVVEELATRKTLGELVAWSTDRMAGRPADTQAPAVSVPAVSVSAPVGRYRLEVVPAPLVDGDRAGTQIAICADGPAGRELADMLRADGADVQQVAPGTPIGDVDTFVDLTPGHDVVAMRGRFERIREAALGGAQKILVATTSDDLGRAEGTGGPAGLIRTLALEWPGITARAVHLESECDTATTLRTELRVADRTVEVGYVGGNRVRPEIVAAALPTVDRPFPLDAESVVLVTGGARGITAKAAIAIAERYGCRIELIGRSPIPADEDPALAGAVDARSLRSLLAADVAAPAEIEARCRRVLADREIRATLAALGELGSYRVADVRSAEFGDLIDELYAIHGRIAGVIHGAGVLEDKLIRHKTGESFERVFATKVVGVRTLVERLRDDVDVVVFFSSISGVLGNRGQSDYAAAGDVLDKLAWSLQRRISGRVVSIDWGPWGDIGMAAGLAGEYARRGIDLIDPVLGVEALLAELATGDDAQVILSAADPRLFVGSATDV